MFSYHLLNRLVAPDAASPENALSFAVSSAVHGLLPHDNYVQLAARTDVRALSPADLGSRMATLLSSDCNPLLDLIMSCETAQQFTDQWNLLNDELPLGVVTQVSRQDEGVRRTSRSGDDTALREHVVCALIEQLDVLRTKRLASRRALSRVASDVRRVGDLVVDLIDYLFQAPFVDLAECVAELGCSKRTLQRELNRAGFTFLGLRSAVRLNFSKEQLRDTSESMTAVALASGFYDAAHFCHAFRAACGINPRRYRALLRRSTTRDAGAFPTPA